MHDVDTSLLRTFLILAETASFSRAGERVGRSQSAVSGQIKKLEDVFGCRLLERDTRNVRLTRDGERLLGHARQMVQAADAMLERFRHAEVVGEVRFGSPEDFATAYLPSILGAFARAHDKVALHVACDLTLPLLQAFEAGQQDVVVIKLDPRRRHPGAIPLWREELVWVATSEDSRSFAATAERLRARRRPLPLVAAPAPCVYRNRAAQALDAAGLPWAAVYASPSFAGALAAVRAGLGVSVMPRAMVPEDLAILEVADGWPDLQPAEICLLGRPDATPPAKALIGFIADHARALVSERARR